MAIVVVGGSAGKAGKTALICGLVSALPEFAWTAVKITDHVQTGLPAIHEETMPGYQSETARYLMAGAQRAFLLAAEDDELALGLRELGEKLDDGAHLIFDSSRVLRHVRPEVAIAIGDGPGKPSFTLVLYGADALVVHAEDDSVITGEKPVFKLAAFEHISVAMQKWLRKRLSA